MKANFKQSQVDPCLYVNISPSIIFLVYIDNCLLISPMDDLIDQGIKDLCSPEPCFKMEDQGATNDFLGIQVKYNNKGEIIFTQHQLIASILTDLHLQCNNIIACKTPALSMVLLQKDPEGNPMHPEFNYHSVIFSCPNLVYTVHQCTCFSTNPKQLHTNAVKHIGCYLKGTPTLRITLCLDNQYSFQCWVDTDLSSNWMSEGAAADPMTVKSCSGWVITYKRCPIMWASKLRMLLFYNHPIKKQVVGARKCDAL